MPADPEYPEQIIVQAQRVTESKPTASTQTETSSHRERILVQDYTITEIRSPVIYEIESVRD